LLPAANFNSLKVLSLESRRSVELSRLIENYGGIAISAPAMREIPLADNHHALNFARRLIAGQFDLVVFLTGVGARALHQVLSEARIAEPFITALRKVKVIVRGPKPLAVMREWNVPVAAAAPEPNTWKELLVALAQLEGGLLGQRVAVQAYGVSNQELLAALREFGAIVTEVAVYRWDLPLDTSPLREAVGQIISRQIDIALFTTSVQIDHLFRIADEIRDSENLRAAFRNVVVAAIGPDTSQTLRKFGIAVDLEASHPRMGFLVKEAAEQSTALIARKRTN
jgi:uroporphyrinogen-III synthase